MANKQQQRTVKPVTQIAAQLRASFASRCAGRKGYMKIVHYESNAPWVGKMKCPNPKCGKETPAWQSSGMSDSCPHFFCDTCSNVIHREQDHALLYEHEANQELLEQIAATLPNCPCGGRFVPGPNPKSPSCKTEYAHQWDAVKRLNVPFMLI